MAAQYGGGPGPIPDEVWVDEDRFTFDDSDRFEDDSLCSWSSEPESLLNNWRGWKKPGAQSSPFGPSGNRNPSDGGVPSLTELTARCVASQIPFELVERIYPPVPEQLQLRIAFWSFPDNEEDIRLYSCLANGSSEEFSRGDHLFRNKAVRDPLQIGFHLSAKVEPTNDPSNRGCLNVAVTFDRRRVTSCNCTCNSTAYWCSHVVAVCLHRINKSDTVTLRAPVSESLSRLHREQLQKFAQYLISELPQQILPTAQRLLDELLSSQPSYINSVCGAPDPTAGASVTDQTSWYLDEKALHENIKKIVIKFCVPAPIVFSDVNYLTTSAPPAASEWTSLLRPLRGREPEGMWNLLSIVREMYKRNDRNAVPLLSIITDECLSCEQILVWWFNTCVALHCGIYSGGRHAAANSNSHTSQHACSSLCEEIVVLWRLAALNPAINPYERKLLEKKFNDCHAKIIEKVMKSRANILGFNNPTLKVTAVEVFPGFAPALQACQMDWEDYPLPGITYTTGSSPVYHSSFTCFRQNNEQNHQVNSSEAVLNLFSYGHHSGHHISHHHPHHTARRVGNVLELFPPHPLPPASRDGNRSSISSEGFCENENEAEDAGVQVGVQYETDSQEGGGSDSVSSSDACPDRQTPPSDRRPLSSESNKKLRGFASKDQSSEESDPGVFTSGPSGSKLARDSGGSGSPSGEWTGSPRPLCNESATSNSDDEGQKSVDGTEASPEKEEEPEKPTKDPWDVLFARAEGLHAHGHGREACTLAVRLAQQLLANPPNLMVEVPYYHNNKGKPRRRVHPLTHQMSCLASATLAKCAFLCAVLTEAEEHHSLAFLVGLFGLEMARPPASTKPLEVKLVNQESELVALLKKIPLGSDELAILRQKAQQLKDGTMRSRGEALLPIMLATFIFDALVGSSSVKENQLPTDERLAFEAAIATLGLKANVTEAEHPLLCEGTRRQRGELVITLLVHYKDAPPKLARVMEKLLDRDVHKLVKAPFSNWYSSNTSQPRNHPPPMKLDNMEMKPPPPMPPPPIDPGLPMDMPPPGSRPPSSTSAEMDQSIAAMTLNAPPAPPGPAPMSRGKDTPRFKQKRVYLSIPNQPSEAGAHFMFELAKVVLMKAGGNSSTSLFTQASTSQQHHGPNRALHFCAFQMGLYALGLHNCVSPNWLSRTYSSHVSWITGQAMEIGTSAINFLIHAWEGHLTPPEAASIADRASRGCDPNMVRAAADLALSCLPHAQALNPNEITRAIVQCKEQSETMLEHSCLTVETAAKGGGVYPEVLFQVAKYWFDLYLRSGGNDGTMDMDFMMDPLPIHFSMDTHGGLLLVEQSSVPPSSSEIPPGGVVMTSPPLLPVSYVTPYSFTLHPTFHQVYLTPPPYQLPPQQYFLQPSPYPVGAMQPMGQNSNPMPQNVAVAGVSVMPPPPANMHNMQSIQNMQNMQSMPSMANMSSMPPPSALVPGPVTMGQTMPGRPVHQQQVHRGGQSQSQSQSQYSPAHYHRCLLNSYRVGMLALETLARRVHDDRPQAKYARNPPYGEDVKWLLRVSKKLGTQYVHQFCYCVVNSIVSPFILYEVAVESAHFLARNNSQLVVSHLRSALAPLVSKCQQMYIQCLHQKLYHLSTADHEDFVNVVCSARSAFNITPEGAQQFKDWLGSIKRSKSCKKDLWTQINTALQSNTK